AAIADLLGRHPEVHVVGAQSLISSRGIPIDPGRIHPLATYPLSRVLRAFDLAIAAPGYNSFHELLAHAVPTLFIPNEETALDDQAARAEWGQARGVSLLGREGDPAQLEDALHRLLKAEVRAELAARCRELPAMDGARTAAAIIAAGPPAATGPHANGAAARPSPAPARSPSHPIQVVRRTVRRTRAAVQPELDRALRALRMRAAGVLPWRWVPPKPAPAAAAPPPRRALLVADRENTGVEELVAWASAHPGGAVILAGARALQPLRRAGLAVELITDPGGDDIGARLDHSAYWDQKLRLLFETYDVGPVLFRGDADLRRHWPVLLLLDR
ncbi:MAG TPA: hypothetical protein VFU21_15030, partial [Kofleriaceae bacterium]|nr:hypothetical protein [Kofleriaceae bacterium]